MRKEERGKEQLLGRGMQEREERAACSIYMGFFPQMCVDFFSLVLYHFISFLSFLSRTEECDLMKSLTMGF